MIVLDFSLVKSNHRNAQWVRQVLSLCALAAGAACSGQPGSAPSPVPAEPTVASSSAVTTTTVVTTTTAELRSLPYPSVEGEERDIEVRVRFIAYGDVDPSDDINFGMIPDLLIAVINDGRESSDWWNTVGVGNFDDMPPGARMHIPPGAQIQSTAEAIAASPIDFITTRLDGTSETYLNPSEYFSVCVISPVDALIAGCSLSESIWGRHDPIFYIYFSHGRVYIDRGQDGSERYHRFLYGHQGSYSLLGEPATITFISTGDADGFSGYDFVGKYLRPDAEVVVISDTDIGAWWDAVSDFYEATYDDGAYPLRVAINWDLGWGIPYGYAAREMARERIVNTGPTGIVDIDLAPGDYLFCHLTSRYIAGCDYEDIAAAKNYIFDISYRISKLSDNEGIQLLEDAENWEIKPNS